MSEPELANLQEKINQELNAKLETRILEAGCGSASNVDFPSDAYLIGIDVSEKQLSRNSNLKEKILGDLQVYNLPPRSLDVIVCWNVLEHLKYPQKALSKFSDSIKIGGLLVLAVPNVLSVKGLVAKFTPHLFHIWFYRYIMGSKLAGHNDHGPFPTFLDLSITPENIKLFAKRNNFRVEYFELLEYGVQRRHRRMSPLLNLMFYLVGALAIILTFGKVSVFKSDLLVLLKKING